jgi:hypothetical protein
VNYGIRTWIGILLFHWLLSSGLAEPVDGWSEDSASPNHNEVAAPAVITVTVKDLTPKFLAFYQAAEKERATPERRWELWKTLYGFAAVPPTPEGSAIARNLLDKAWLRYPAALTQIRAGASEMTPRPDRILLSVSNLLRPEKPGSVRLLVYVGGFEDSAFTFAHDGHVTTAIPIEMDPKKRALFMAHELTHAVHINMGSFSGGWQRTIGATVLTEGLAMRVAQKLFPRHADKEFIEITPGWLNQATAHVEKS